MADAFEFADGMVKQLLTLATGSLGGIVAIFDAEEAGIQLSGSPWLMWSIGLLAVSIVSGIITLGCLTAQLAKKNGTANANARGVRFPAMAQMVAFGAGVLAIAGEIVLPG